MNVEDFNMPEFLLAEYPIKDGGFNDQRIFIVHRGLSLIEVISHEIHPAFVTFDGKLGKQYSYSPLEEFTLVYHTNNTIHHNIDPKDLLDMAWEWFSDYLQWEDHQIDDL